MSDSRGKARALTVLTPVARGHEQALRAALEALPTGEQSPLAGLPGTHFARFVVVPGLEPDSDHLLFSSIFDEGSHYLEEMRARMPEKANAIWCHCEGYPGTDDPKAFETYMENHRLRTNLFVAAYPDATLPQIRRALGLRERLIEFAPRAQSMSHEELQASFYQAVLRERQLAPSR